MSGVVRKGRGGGGRKEVVEEMMRRVTHALLVATPAVWSPVTVGYMWVQHRRKSSMATMDYVELGLQEAREVRRKKEEEFLVFMEKEEEGRRAEEEVVAVSGKLEVEEVFQGCEGDGTGILEALEGVRSRKGKIDPEEGAFAVSRLGALGLHREMFAVAEEVRCEEVSASVLQVMQKRGDAVGARNFMKSLGQDASAKRLQVIALETCLRAGNLRIALEIVKAVPSESLHAEAVQLVLRTCLVSGDHCEEALQLAEAFGLERLSVDGRRDVISALVRLDRFATAQNLVSTGVVPGGDATQAAFISGLREVEQAEAFLSELQKIGVPVGQKAYEALMKTNLDHGQLSRAEDLQKQARINHPKLVDRLITALIAEGSFERARRAALANDGHEQSVQVLAERARSVSDVEEAFGELEEHGWKPWRGAYINLARLYSMSGNARGVSSVQTEMRKKGMSPPLQLRRFLIQALVAEGRTAEAYAQCSDDLGLRIETLALTGQIDRGAALLRKWRQPKRNQRAVDALVRAAAAQGDLRTALSWWKTLQDEQCVPSSLTATTVLRTLVNTGQYMRAAEVYQDFADIGGRQDRRVLLLAVEANIGCGRSIDLNRIRREASKTTRSGGQTLQEADATFESHLLRVFADADMVTEAMDSLELAKDTLPGELVDNRFYDPIVTMLARKGRTTEMEKLMKEMKRRGLKLSKATNNAVLLAARVTRDADRVNDHFDRLSKEGTAASEHHITSVCLLLAKEGKLDLAWQRWCQLERTMQRFSQPLRICDVLVPCFLHAGAEDKAETILRALRRKYPNTDWHLRAKKFRPKTSL